MFLSLAAKLIALVEVVAAFEDLPDSKKQTNEASKQLAEPIASWGLVSLGMDVGINLHFKI